MVSSTKFNELKINPPKQTENLNLSTLKGEKALTLFEMPWLSSLLLSAYMLQQKYTHIKKMKIHCCV